MSQEILADPVEFAKKLLEALCFEQYLRFFFLDIPDDAEDDAPAILHVPEDIVKDIETTCPKLLPLLNALQDKAITFEQSRSAVIREAAFLMNVDPNSSEYKETAAEISVSELFQDELLEFHTWVQEMDETQDSTEPIPFNQWRSTFRKWRENA